MNNIKYIHKGKAAILCVLLPHRIRQPHTAAFHSMCPACKRGKRVQELRFLPTRHYIYCGVPENYSVGIIKIMTSYGNFLAVNACVNRRNPTPLDLQTQVRLPHAFTGHMDRTQYSHLIWKEGCGSLWPPFYVSGCGMRLPHRMQQPQAAAFPCVHPTCASNVYRN